MRDRVWNPCEPFAHLEVPIAAHLQQLFIITDKQELDKFSRTIEFTREEFAVLVWNSLSIGYAHAIKYEDFQPKHLQPTERDIAGLNGPNRDRQRFIRKMAQIFEERRYLVAHIFYNSQRWHLFYFDQRDTESDRPNHWKHGPHLHFVNDLWPGYDPADLWALFEKADATIGGKLHIRFRSEPRRRGSPLPLPTS